MATSTQVQWRRGSANQAATFVGAQGEIVIDLTNNRIVINDGITLGGWTGALIGDIYTLSGVLQHQINNISGSTGISNLPSTIVYQSGNQIISGTKTLLNALFTQNVTFYQDSTGGSIALNYSPYDLGNYFYVNDVNGTKSIDFWQRLIYDTAGVESIDFSNRNLLDNNSNLSIDWKNRLCTDSSNGLSIGYGIRNLIFSNGNTSVDWQNAALNDNGGANSLNWAIRNVVDSAGNPSINWAGRFLYDINSTLSLDYSNRILNGAWSATSFQATQNFALTPSIKTGNLTLSNAPFYINNYSGSVTWNLPSINSTTGRFYHIKNRGGTITLTGNFGDSLFDAQPVLNFSIPSGYSNIIANDGSYWNIM